MTDFTRQGSGITSPAFGAVAITPSNDTDLTYVTRGVYVAITQGAKTGSATNISTETVITVT